jgi:hypothetical protein
MAGREERVPRPSSEHPIGKALYALQRETWGAVFKTVVQMHITGEGKEQLKNAMIAEIDALKAQVVAL